MPFLISFYLFMRIVRRTFNVPYNNTNNNTTTYYPPPKWDKLMNHPFNEYEW